jgi:hypothetical protein
MGSMLLAGCTDAGAEPVLVPGPSALSGSESADPGTPEPGSSVLDQPAGPGTAVPADPVTWVGGDAAELALGASRALWQTSPVAVVAAADDRAAVVEAADLAVALRAPLLLGPTGQANAAAAPIHPALTVELERLGVTTVVTAGENPPALPAGTTVSAGGEATEPQQPPPPGDVVVLVAPDVDATGAVATVKALDVPVVPLSHPDPRTDPVAIEALAATPTAPVLALGDALGPLDRLVPRLEVAATGVQLPGGGQTLFPGRRLVALYGHPQTSALGVLGEQGPAQTMARAHRLAASYQRFSTEPVVPAVEIIATVASAQAGADGDYSNETSIEVLRPYVDAAARSGVYVVLDLQPGRTDFLTQARAYRELLAQPHVGLALDPEWRLGPGQVHLRQIGSVDAAEVTAVADWLAALVRGERLPQKLLLLHQFQLRMITGRQKLDAQRDELAILVQMDGDGTPGEKLATWRALRTDPPRGLRFGWKNFYDEDTPTFTPRETMAVRPTPWWVSYQ